MTLAFRHEDFRAIASELWPLFVEHWEEIALDKEAIPLAPDWDRYAAMQAAGVLAVMTARDNGALVGYLFFVVAPHLHYRTSYTAVSDLLFLRKSQRKGLAASRFIRASEDMLRARGVQRVYMSFKVQHDLSPLVERLGYKPVDKVYSRLL